MEDHLEALMANPQQVLRQMQRTFHGQNCPAVAAAVHRYLQTGESRQAADNLGGGFICTNPLYTRNEFAGYVSTISSGAVGNCAVIGTHDGRPSHYFNMVKLDAGVYFVDAFTSSPIFSQQESGLVSGYGRFEFFRDFSCHRST